MSEQHLPILDFGSTSTAFADTVAIEQHVQAHPFFEIFVREGNGSRSEQQS